MLELKWRTRKKKKGPPSRTAYISGTYGGHRVRESLGSLGREAAQKKFERRRAEIVSAVDAGRDPDLRVATAIADYSEDCKDDRFLDPIIAELGETRIADLTTPDVQRAAKRLYPKAKAATWNRQVIAPLMAAINHCADKRMCPPIKIERFKEGKVSKVAIDRAWVDAFRAAAIELGLVEFADMELMMFTTAARLGDCEALDWRDVHIERRIAVFRDTKNGNDRDALLTDELARALAARRPADGRGSVFGIWSRGGRGSFYRRWAEICERADIEYVTPHQAGRHSFATEMIVRNKVDVKTTAELGGWNSPQILVDRYTHPEQKRQVVDDIFSGTSSAVDDRRRSTDAKSDANVVPMTKKA